MAPLSDTFCYVWVTGFNNGMTSLDRPYFVIWTLLVSQGMQMALTFVIPRFWTFAPEGDATSNPIWENCKSVDIEIWSICCKVWFNLSSVQSPQKLNSILFWGPQKIRVQMTLMLSVLYFTGWTRWQKLWPYTLIQICTINKPFGSCHTYLSARWDCHREVVMGKYDILLTTFLLQNY